ncbi:MAG: dTDP-glucose 4,6-dehydratase [Elusimicrobiota bacterium]|jgi:dTDP-glucose 4,6-dehydratase|nr:dTDP-glucose 4,6-dehydratase [Elusimicrobiota bacterium]
MRNLTNVLVTGGAGFIGCNFIRMLLTQQVDFKGRIINLDALTYAGNCASLCDIFEKFNGGRYFFKKGDICDKPFVCKIFEKYDIDTVVHFAAESHVDRSILAPDIFIKTNVNGTFTLLETARNFWKKQDGSFSNCNLFHHVSTDEVYGSLGAFGYFTEKTAYAPRSTYSASKAAGDHLVMAYNNTYGLPATLSNCSNNYGPYQLTKNFVPLMILNMLKSKPLPVYGDGKNIRDWLYVKDHTNAIWTILQKGKTGEKYNIGGENEIENIMLLEVLIETISKKTNICIKKLKNLITFVKDRPGHDRRYAIDCSKIKKELAWEPKTKFKDGISETVEWYLHNKIWIENRLNENYKNCIAENC